MFFSQQENLLSEVFNDEENDETFNGFVPEELLSSSIDEDDENPIDFMKNWQDIEWPRTDISFIRVLGLNVNLEDQWTPLIIELVYQGRRLPDHGR